MESITMGNIHEDHLKNPVQEDGPQDPDVGAGVRSYECIFCRRGFTTAQALGGHMNIHRKDRAKNRPTYLSNNYYSNKQEEDHNSNLYANHPRYYNPVFARYPQTYNHENNHGLMMKSPASRDEKMMSLSLQFGWSHEHEEDDDEESKRRTRGGCNEDELDLELRLGYDP
ncbi:hypothetical protein SSX86_011677 [Deinandra increscens subsp. villosa]|uniref:C2H2-type domain-containing protein n=1 Tax=Deinandra increscens subsp. villosa TaxID=3103831 RepID=A0AAP0D4E9_9ASTR